MDIIRNMFRGAAAGFMMLAVTAAAAAAADPAKPNVLLITIDTLRPDRLGCYGSTMARTPAIDALAASGTVFTRAFAHTPLTLPSHTNILLGTTPLRHGVHDNGYFKVPAGSLSLAKFLKAEGYATGAFVGAFPLDARFGLNAGFDVYDDNYGSGSGLAFQFAERKAEVVVKSAMAWLDAQKGPWFLWVHCFDPHQPYEPPEPFAGQYRNDLYSGEVAYTDHALAPLLERAAKSSGSGPAIVILTGDHGQSLGEHGETTHGYFAYNSTLWIPLIISSPGLKPGRVDKEVCHTDIFPTLCQLLGLPRPAPLQGRSLVDLMRGKSMPAERIYFEALYPYYTRGWAPIRGFIENGLKYIDSPIPELYDLKSDFNETNNLAGRGLAREKDILAGILKEQAAPAESGKNTLDAKSREKLMSLGYVGGFQPPAKKSFGPADDLKTLLPFNRKFEEAQALYFKGQADQSVRMLKELITAKPDFDNPYLFLVTIYEKQKRLADAESILKSGSEANPSNYKLAIEYGIALASAGKNDQAIDVLTRARKIIDWDPELWNYLGVAYWNKGDLDRAVEAYRYALDLDPGYAVVLANLGTVETSLAMKKKDNGLLAEAREHFQKALEHDERSVSAYNGLGAVYRLSGDMEAAMFCWTKALEIDPDHRFALYNLGTACLDKGDKKQALARLSKYKELYYAPMPAAEKADLDKLLARCR